ncbi:MAG TPA: amidohydrolase family protein [Bryobacteraceae bacterium]|nr:amidohydrolase family protein [Bryobacteraceae bacterium]
MRLLFSALLGCAVSVSLNAQITVRASTMLDGKGAVRRNVRVTIDGSKIVRVEADSKGPVSYDLTGLTLMPGWIDTHVHVNGHFNKDGRADTRGESPAEFALRTEGTLWDTLQGGFTTVRSVGANSDKEFRDLIAEGVVPGPRILTSLATFNEHSGAPEEIRQKVRERVAQGADVIKLFATASSRDGGAQTMSDAQIEAACSEAKALGRPAAVHAHASGGAKPAVLSGCTSIEHGTFLTDEVLDLMAQRGVYLDPNLSNVPNYINHQQAFLGLGNFTEQGFAEMAKDLPIRFKLIQRAMARKVMIVFGTDAVAGLPGHNSEEFVMRVQDGKQPPMDAIVSATSRAAESIGLGSKIGAIAPGMEADLVATEGNPIDDITNVRKVMFVMKGGKVYKNASR